MLGSIVLTIGCLFGLASATPRPNPDSYARELYQFPNETFIENVAVLSDGRLLLNTFDDGQIFILDPSSPEPEPHALVKIPGINQLTGIAQVKHNVFAVSGGVAGADYIFVNGSALIATVDLNHVGGSAVVEIVAKIPNTMMLNGMVALPHAPHIVLSADSINGRIFRTNTMTGDVDIAFRHDLIGPGPDPQIVPLGANGLEIYNGYLYFTNSNLQFFARVSISLQGYASGEIEEIYRLPPGQFNAFDDFSMTHQGTAYIGSQRDSLVMITPDGHLKTLLGPESQVKLLSPTSVALTKDEKTAYVVTGGLNGLGGQVVQVRLGCV